MSFYSKALMRLFTFILCSSFGITFSFLTQIAYAEDRVIVTATKDPQSTEKLPQSVSKIDEDDWNQAGGILEQALAPVPGVYVSASGGPGQLRTVQIRGAKSEHTLVLVDGIRVNDPVSASRTFDFGSYGTGVDSIEILRGPQSVLYGSDAIGGVIQIFTTKLSKGPHVYLEGGSQNTVKANVSAYGFRAGIEKSRGISEADANEGNTERDGYQNFYMGGSQTVPIAEKADLDLVANLSDSTTDTDKAVGRGGDSSNTFSRDRQLIFGAKTHYFLHEGADWSVTGSLIDVNREDNTFSNSYFRGDSWQVGTSYRDKITENHEATVGIETFKESGTTSDFTGTRYFRGGGVYVQDAFEVGNFHGSLGLRGDAHSEHETAKTIRASLGQWMIARAFRWKANFGTGFKAPTLYQTYSTFGTPGLRPERSYGGDFGLEWKDSDLHLEATYFQNRFRDLINFQSNHFVNITTTETKGFEFLAAIREKYYGIENAFTLLRSKDRSTGLTLLRCPQNLNTTTITGYFGNTEISGVMRYVGTRDDVDPNSLTFARKSLPSFYVFGANGTQRLSEQAKLHLRIDNLLNRQYQELAGFGTRGFSAYLGAEFNL